MISIPPLESQLISLLSTTAAVHHHLPPSLLSSSQLCPRLPPISTAASRCFFHPVSGPLRSFSVAATATFMANSVPPRNGVYTVGDFMTRKEDLHVVNPTTTVDEALELLVENRITGFPVIDDTWKLVGLVSDYDLLALDSISGGGRTDTNMFPEVDSTWKVGWRTHYTPNGCQVEGERLWHGVPMMAKCHSQRLLGLRSGDKGQMEALSDFFLRALISPSRVNAFFTICCRKTFNEVQKLLSKTNGKLVGDLMTTAPVVVRESTNLEDAARILLETKYRRLPVVDSEGKLVGIITRGNVVRAALQIKRANETKA
ncbi:hypothetical protein C3L33_18417, partial [Rhododendron williamsianum]